MHVLYKSLFIFLKCKADIVQMYETSKSPTRKRMCIRNEFHEVDKTVLLFSSQSYFNKPVSSSQ